MMNSQSSSATQHPPYHPTGGTTPAAAAAAAASQYQNVQQQQQQHGAQVAMMHVPHQPLHQQQQQQPMYMQTHQQQPLGGSIGSGSGVGSVGGGGGPLYNNLIPGHYRYGAKPPAPPPGPLSYSNTSLQQQQQYGMANQQQQQSYGVNQNQQQQQQQQQQQNLQQQYGMREAQQYASNGQMKMYQNIAPTTTTNAQTSQHITMMQQQQQQQQQNTGNGFDIVQVSEPDDDYEDLLVVAPPEVHVKEEDDEDDEQYYRPFRHTGAANNISNGSIANNASGNTKGGKTKDSQTIGSNKNRQDEVQVVVEETKKPVDLLAVLLGSAAHKENLHNHHNNTTDLSSDIATLIGEASSKSQRARSMTEALASKQGKCSAAEKGAAKEGGGGADNSDYLYAATSNAHAEAALSFQRVYRTLLGLKVHASNNGDKAVLAINSTVGPGGGGKVNNNMLRSPSEELARSMLVLANGHARMAKSLGAMGTKWNMGKIDSRTGRMVSKDGTLSASVVDGKKNDGMSSKGTINKDKTPHGKDTSTSPSSTTSNHASSITSTCTTTSNNEHERLRMAVRGALDTANHEEDITNSTFLARSTIINAKKQQQQQQQSKIMHAVGVKSKNVLLGAVRGRKSNGEGGGKKDGGVNPVDDLMKLEKELRCMDMALEMGNSVANLGGAATSPSPSRPGDGSFCVVPPGSSYMSSSSMWTSGILGGGGGNVQHQHQQQHHSKPQHGMAGVRSRANHLQNFLGGKQPPAAPTSHAQHASPTRGTVTKSQSPRQQNGIQITPSSNGANALDQSWWGGGQGSILASSAISTAAASSNQRPPLSSGGAGSGTNQNTNPADSRQSSTNAKQLMQLMDSLNRLGNENAQLMREVEDAKAARAEAKAAKDMMAKFKTEYTQRFTIVKEALKKYPQQQQSNGGADNVVTNSAYMKSASMQEIQKRDQMIKQLSTDLKKERDECKKKDSALQKYEAFYREVKARSAEKARQRQLQEQQQQQKQQQKKKQAQQKMRVQQQQQEQQHLQK